MTVKRAYESPNCRGGKGYRFSDDGPYFQPGKLYRRSAYRGFTEEGHIMESDGVRCLGYYRFCPGDVHVRWIGVRNPERPAKMKNFHYPTPANALLAAGRVREEARLP